PWRRSWPRRGHTGVQGLDHRPVEIRPDRSAGLDGVAGLRRARCGHHRISHRARAVIEPSPVCRPAPVSFRYVKRVSPTETHTHATRTVERACSVLSALSAAEPRLGLRELTERVGLPRATVHRLAGSLVAAGF